MIAWLHPAALAGLVAVAIPIVVHLLRRERARRVVVPSLRFVRASERSAVRLRTPADPWLLLVRIAIIACAALAAARPLLLTEARSAAWADRLARAVIVDTSASMQAGVTAEQIAAAAGTASPSVTIDAMDLRRGIERAVSWLATAPPARREIVILSDFQRGALSGADLTEVPAAVGIRLVLARPPIAPAAPALEILGPEGAVPARATALEEATAVTYGAPRAIDGLEIVSGPEHSASIERLRRIVGAAGAVAPSPDQPIVIRFAGAAQPEADSAPPAWAVAAGARLLDAPEVRDVDLGVAIRDGRLVVDVDAAPDSLEAALAVKAALDARLDPMAFSEAEPQRIPDAALAAWSRPPGDADVTGWRRTDESDGRWLWAFALVLLAVEVFLRRGAQEALRVEKPHAA